MWSCRKCGKPVYFAERRTSLGYEWHPECLRCEECGKRLNPGQHAEHKGVPYCHIPCYSALFGPTLFGHGSRVESHTSFGKIENRQATSASRGHVEAKLKIYNQYYEGKSGELKCRERNGRLILEGVLRIYWGVCNPIHLKEEHDARIPVCKRNSYRAIIYNQMSSDDQAKEQSKDNYQAVGYKTLPSRLDSLEKDKNSDSNNEAKFNMDDLYTSTPNVIYGSEESSSTKPRLRRRRCGNAKLKRRCSINGHFYNRETSVFTPSYGSVTHVWVTSLVNTSEVINMLLDKFKVENNPQDFALFIVRDNGERRFIELDEYPLLTRVMLGPHEDVAKVFIMNKTKTEEISPEVAQYIQLSDPELKAIVDQFFEEEAREVLKIKKKFRERQLKLEYYKIQLDILHKYGLYGGGGGDGAISGNSSTSVDSEPSQCAETGKSVLESTDRTSPVIPAHQLGINEGIHDINNEESAGNSDIINPLSSVSPDEGSAGSTHNYNFTLETEDNILEQNHL